MVHSDRDKLKQGEENQGFFPSTTLLYPGNVTWHIIFYSQTWVQIVFEYKTLFVLRSIFKLNVAYF